MKRSDKSKITDILPDGEPRIGNPDKGILLSPLYPNRIGFVSQRAEPRVNEQGAVEACKAIVEYLNARGANYEAPQVKLGRENGVDCISQSPEETLNFQVTRAMRDQDFWKYLGINKGVMAYREQSELADDLWDAILHKAKRTPIVDRSSIILVLDAADLFAHHSDKTVAHFVSSYGEKVLAIGFSSIWVSGGYSCFVHKLS